MIMNNPHTARNVALLLSRVVVGRNLYTTTATTTTTTTTPLYMTMTRQKQHHFFSSMAQQQQQQQQPEITTISLPTRHSRYELPPICSDDSNSELEELTNEILNADVGSLFQYDTTSSSSTSSVTHDREEAWKVANVTVQKVEYLLRGYAVLLPNTMWDRWTSKSTTTTTLSSIDKQVEIIATMYQLLDRLETEGTNYMSIRKQSLKQQQLDAKLAQEQEELKQQQDLLKLQDMMNQTTSSNSNATSVEDILRDNDDYDDDDENMTFEKLHEKFGSVLDTKTIQNDDDKLKHVKQFIQTSLETQERKLKQQELQYYNEEIVAKEEKQYKSIQDAMKDLKHIQDIKDLQQLVENDLSLKDPLEHFAVPGPTTAMYDTLLDAVATVQKNMNAAATDNNNAELLLLSQFNNPSHLMHLVQNIFYRHQLDCNSSSTTTTDIANDKNSTTVATINTNSYTLPTMTSLNAVLRCISLIPYNDQNETSNAQILLRDQCLQVSLEILDFLIHETNRHKKPRPGGGLLLINAATYTYMIQIINKFMPASRSKSNIIFGLFFHAKEDYAVIDKSILHALAQCHEDNYPTVKEFEWISRLMTGDLVFTENDDDLHDGSKIKRLCLRITTKEISKKKDDLNLFELLPSIEIPVEWSRNAKGRRANHPYKQQQQQNSAAIRKTYSAY